MIDGTSCTTTRNIGTWLETIALLGVGEDPTVQLQPCVMLCVKLNPLGSGGLFDRRADVSSIVVITAWHSRALWHAIGRLEMRGGLKCSFVLFH